MEEQPLKGCYVALSLPDDEFTSNDNDKYKDKDTGRLAQLAKLPRSKFDPELFPHSAYVKNFVTFATKVPYLTFCNKM